MHLPVDISENALWQRESSIHPEVALWSSHQRVAHPVEKPVGLVLWSNSAYKCVSACFLLECMNCADSYAENIFYCLVVFWPYHCQLCVQQCFPNQAVGVPRNRTVRTSPAGWAHTHSQRLKQIKYVGSWSRNVSSLMFMYFKIPHSSTWISGIIYWITSTTHDSTAQYNFIAED